MTRSLRSASLVSSVFVLGLTMWACEESSTSTPPNTTHADIDAGPSGPSDSGPPVTQCPTPTGAPTEHESGSIATETWTAAGSPHVIPYDTTLTGTLILEPCAEVLIGAGKTLSLGPKGALVAIGTANEPIHIGGKGGVFASIRGSGGSTLKLAYVNLDSGGDPLNTIKDYAGLIDLQGTDQVQPTQPLLSVDHVTIAGSGSNGIVLRTGAGFAPGSRDLTVKGAAQYPVSIWSRAVGTLPSGTYTGNTTDEILLPATGGHESMRESTTIFDRGVPYRVGNSGSHGTLYIEAATTGALATVTIEPGVKMRVKKGGVIHVESSAGENAARGALVAKGTAAKPITFTSAEATPAAGDWLGIWFGQVPAAANSIQYAEVAYAGGTSSSGGAACNVPPFGLQNDAAIRIFGPPGRQFVTNTKITSSAAHGIDRGWRANDLSDFLATNTFTGVARCQQSYPRDANGACPDEPIPCPQ